MVFNPDKFQFGKDVVEFAGFELTVDGYRQTAERLQAILDFPVPVSLTDVRLWFGLVEQVKYAFAKSELMSPFRELLRQNRKFYWDETLTVLFKKTRAEVAKLVKDGVKTFELGRETMLTNDWSKTGVGFLLRQK